MGNASQQAYRVFLIRATSTTLGKLMINKLREDWTNGRGGRGPGARATMISSELRAAADLLVRKQMLGDDYEGDGDFVRRLAAMVVAITGRFVEPGRLLPNNEVR
jgi:hypothetical protein